MPSDVRLMMRVPRLRSRGTAPGEVRLVGGRSSWKDTKWTTRNEKCTSQNRAQSLPFNISIYPLHHAIFPKEYNNPIIDEQVLMSDTVTVYRVNFASMK